MRALAISTAIAAAGLAPVSASAADFSGGYVGASAGIFTSTQVEISNDAFFVDNPTTRSGIEDWMFTKLDGLVGYGTQTGGVYVGGELTYTFANNHEGTVYSDSSVDREFSAEDGWSMGVRLGFVDSARWMGYAKLAYGQRTYEQSVTGFGTDDEDFSGPGFGLGAEYMATDAFSIRLDAMRFDYSSESFETGDYDPVETSVDLAAVLRF